MLGNVDAARRAALALLKELGLTEPAQLVPELIASTLGLVVRSRPLIGLDGYLLRGKHHGVIAYRETIKEPGRVRFTIGHEIGHWRLHTHLNQSQLCTSGDIVGYRGSAMENEANAFASEMLMPNFMVAPCLKWASATVQKAVELAARFGTSLTAASIKLVESIDQPAILVASKDNSILWSAHNPRVKHLFLPKGSGIDHRLPAWNCMSSLQDVEPPESVPGEAWFPHTKASFSFDVHEQSAVLGDYGITLSYLTVYE